jgi:hypothetical protein
MPNIRLRTAGRLAEQNLSFVIHRDPRDGLAINGPKRVALATSDRALPPVQRRPEPSQPTGVNN